MSFSDIHVESARLQAEIEDHLGIAGSLVFDYVNQEGKVKLNLITINSRHNQSFLFHSEVGIDKIDVLRKMREYVRGYRTNKEDSYTIQWRAMSDTELHTSYFRAKNMYQALDKLYYNRDMNAIQVYSIVMNPVA